MLWTPKQRIIELPSQICHYYIREARELLRDLENNKPEFGLKPNPIDSSEGKMQLYKLEGNPNWYKEIYHTKEWFRRDRSLKCLDRIIKTEDQIFRPQNYQYTYDNIYRNLIHQRLLFGHVYENQDGSEVFYDPIPDVLNFFFMQEEPDIAFLSNSIPENWDEPYNKREDLCLDDIPF